MLSLSRVGARLCRTGDSLCALSALSRYALCSRPETGLKTLMPLLVPAAHQAREESNSFLLETVQRIKVPGVLPLSLDVEEAPTLPPMLCKRKKHYRKQGRKVMGMVSSKSRRRVSINGSLH